MNRGVVLQMTMDIRTFKLAWRWTDPKYTEFPEAVLNQLFPLNMNEALKIDSKLRSFYDGPKLKRELLYAWERHHADIPCESFLEGLSIQGETEVYLSWDIETALKTNWNIFSQYWDDFCYPASDDLTIIPVDETWILAYFHEEIFEYGKIR